MTFKTDPIENMEQVISETGGFAKVSWIDKMKNIILTLSILLAFITDAFPDTHYMPSQCSNLAACFSTMSSGDILEIANGTYTGSSNAITQSQQPPSGSAGAYTTIRAATPGGVIIDGQNSVNLMEPYNVTHTLSYINFDGIQWVRSTNDFGITGSSHTNRTVHHMKWTRCGFQSFFNISYNSYVLVEDCYVTGIGRYNFQAFCTDHIIFRRCIARMDNGQTGGDPFSNFVSYGSQNVEFQNCIVIDTDSNYSSGAIYGMYGGIYFRKTYSDVSPQESDTNNAQRGCILLNCKIRPNMGSFGVAQAIGTGVQLTSENNIFYDLVNMMYWDNGSPSSLAMNHNTIGKATFSGSYSYGTTSGSSSVGSASNSIYANLSGTAIYLMQSSTYNAFYGNGTDKSSVGSSSNDITGTNPFTNHLKYLPRIENYAGLDGSDGKKRGAEVLWRYGVDGSMYGDTGYATLRNSSNGYGGDPDKLWPWPYESTVKTFFLNYGTGGSNPPNARGFTTGTSMDGSSQTLTKYIWEYLGNQIPNNIYGGSPPAAPTHLSLTISSGGTIH